MEQQRKDFAVQKEAERKDFDVQKKNERADRANVTRGQIMKKKVQDDSATKREKVILDAQNDRLKEALTAMQGNTPSPYDIE
jgi:hypothetical protein